jgi:hypothetical protein
MNKRASFIGASLPLVLVSIVFRSSHWKTIRTASGAAEELQDQANYLQSGGFRCRLRADESLTSMASSRARPGLTALQVHENDVLQAVEALKHYDRRQAGHQPNTRAL